MEQLSATCVTFDTVKVKFEIKMEKKHVFLNSRTLSNWYAYSILRRWSVMYYNSCTINVKSNIEIILNKRHRELNSIVTSALLRRVLLPAVIFLLWINLRKSISACDVRIVSYFRLDRNLLLHPIIIWLNFINSLPRASLLTRNLRRVVPKKSRCNTSRSH